MPQQMFLSHDSRDHVQADTLSRMISRLTLGQISVWHSSDNSPDGGLQPGHVWLDEIRLRLAASKAVVVLLTPTSLSRPWLLFESGFGAAQPGCDVIPVCVGVDRLADIPFPLAMYQTYQLSDYESLRRFAEKLTSKYDILFDEAMANPVLIEAVKQLSHSNSSGTPEETKKDEPSLSEVIVAIKEHIDRRALSVMQDEDESGFLSIYNVPIYLNRKSKSEPRQFVEIDSNTSVQDVLDRIYFMLDDEVQAYKYLVQWVLRDMLTQERLIIKEIESRIPARVIFKLGSKWEVIRLSQPYSAARPSAEEEQ